ncbi:MAG TPA: hypothetical protein VJ715_11250, partial [Pyrinomonadaceae bacterium]|nr:hypothetical protein [Pyrinomonadaceae bacterium]
MTVSLLEQLESAIAECADDISALHERCMEAAPNYDIDGDAFGTAVRAAIDKYLVDTEGGTAPTPDQIRQFIGELQITDLYLAVACARGNEHAW